MEKKETFYTSTNSSKHEALENHAKSMSEVKADQMAFGGFYSNVEDGISVRPPFTRKAWERFRPNEKIPTKDAEVMTACREAYESVGLIRSVVDLMTEIAVEGLDLVSENEGIQNFFKQWSIKTNIKERAERFANYFVVEGNVVLGRKFESIDTPSVRRMKRDSANAAKKSKIPLSYTFYDPQTIVLIGGEAAIFSGIKRWGVKISSTNISNFKALIKSQGSDVISNVSDEIKKAIINAKTGADLTIQFPEDEIYVAHYKKKDSAVWAKSFIYSILHDVIYNEKLRMAKISALDSWYNSVRLWRLGDHKEEILPDIGSIVRLSNVLENHSGGTLDIIWDSMLQYDQYFPPIEKLENFTENYESMLLGLGIHKSLVGGNAASSGSNDSFMGLRNLMKRIDSIRRAITEWIQSEIDIVSEELGFQSKPKIKFSVDNLFDQPSYFKLLTELNDRNIISNQTIVEKIGEMWDIEKARVRKEEEDRKSGDVSTKYSPFIQTEIPDANHKKNKEMLKLKQESATAPVQITEDPKLRPGRPDGSRDKVKRKVSKRIRAYELAAAEDFQNSVDAVLDEYFLNQFNAQNKRQLTAKQKEIIEAAKNKVFSKYGGLEISKDEIFKIADSDVDFSKFESVVAKELREIVNPTTANARMVKNTILAKMASVFKDQHKNA
jgi:predicted GIY-YIG superfamily endonuclease